MFFHKDTNTKDLLKGSSHDQHEPEKWLQQAKALLLFIPVVLRQTLKNIL